MATPSIRQEWWYPQVKQVFDQRGVPVPIWEAILLAESGGKIGAYAGGNEDSVGLFQLNRAGGQGVGYSREQLSDPITNAIIASKAISNSYQQYGDDIREVARKSGHPGYKVPLDDERLDKIAGYYQDLIAPGVTAGAGFYAPSSRRGLFGVGMSTAVPGSNDMDLDAIVSEMIAAGMEDNAIIGNAVRRVPGISEGTVRQSIQRVRGGAATTPPANPWDIPPTEGATRTIPIYDPLNPTKVLSYMFQTAVPAVDENGMPVEGKWQWKNERVITAPTVKATPQDEYNQWLESRRAAGIEPTTEEKRAAVDKIYGTYTAPPSESDKTASEYQRFMMSKWGMLSPAEQARLDYDNAALAQKTREWEAEWASTQAYRAAQTEQANAATWRTTRQDPYEFERQQGLAEYNADFQRQQELNRLASTPGDYLKYMAMRQGELPPGVGGEIVQGIRRVVPLAEGVGIPPRYTPSQQSPAYTPPVASTAMPQTPTSRAPTTSNAPVATGAPGISDIMSNPSIPNWLKGVAQKLTTPSASKPPSYDPEGIMNTGSGSDGQSLGEPNNGYGSMDGSSPGGYTPNPAAYIAGGGDVYKTGYNPASASQYSLMPFTAPKLTGAPLALQEGRQFGPGTFPQGTFPVPGVQAQSRLTPTESGFIKGIVEQQGIPGADWEDALWRARKAVGPGLAGRGYSGVGIRRYA